MAEASDTSRNVQSVAEPSRGLSVYKGGQGYYTRMGTVIGVALVSILGLLWLWKYLERFRVGEVNPLYVAAAGTILVGGILTFVLYWLVFVKPRSVDFLIATEGEMKKVNWSTKREVQGSTAAVIFTMLALTAFCFVIDKGFFAFFAWIKVLDL